MLTDPSLEEYIAFSQEAYNHLSSLVLHKTVKVQLLRKDQYSRIVRQYSARRLSLTGLAVLQVGLAFVRKFPYLWHSSISLEMVKAGRERLPLDRLLRLHISG